MSANLFSAFQPMGPTANVTVTTSSASVTVNSGIQVPRSLYLVNVGTQTVFVAFGNSVTGATAAAATGLPLLPNTAKVFDVPGTQVVAAIAAATGSTLYITPGEGV